MAELNLPLSERDALKSVDMGLLDKVLERCRETGHPTALADLQLERCGNHVGLAVHEYRKALERYRLAKSAKKREETSYDVLRAASDLEHAVSSMRRRAETEEREQQLFYVNDLIAHPSRLSEDISIPIHFQWRAATSDSWQTGTITFTHVVIDRPDFSMPLPKRKPSASQVERDRQDKLHREWLHLLRLGLWAVRDFFRNGGNGSAIPPVFRAKLDGSGRSLNNFSADFWAA